LLLLLLFPHLGLFLVAGTAFVVGVVAVVTASGIELMSLLAFGFPLVGEFVQSQYLSEFRSLDVLWQGVGGEVLEELEVIREGQIEGDDQRQDRSHEMASKGGRDADRSSMRVANSSSSGCIGCCWRMHTWRIPGNINSSFLGWGTAGAVAASAAAWMLRIFCSFPLGGLLFGVGNALVQRAVNTGAHGGRDDRRRVVGVDRRKAQGLDQKADGLAVLSRIDVGGRVIVELLSVQVFVVPTAVRRALWLWLWLWLLLVLVLVLVLLPLLLSWSWWMEHGGSLSFWLLWLLKNDDFEKFK